MTSTHFHVSVGRGTSSRPRVRQTQLDDYAGIAELHRRNHLDVLDQTAWTELWLGNPAFQVAGEAWPLGWVLETTAGEVVGSIGNLPCQYYLGHRPILAGSACSWAVDPAFRGSSLALLSHFMTQQRPELLLSTTVSPSAEAGMRMFGCQRIPSGVWDKTRFWITSYTGAAECWLAKKSKLLSKDLSHPVAAALYLHDNFRRHPSPPDLGCMEVQVSSTFEHQFDEFWAGLLAANTHSLLACRSRATLAWHYRRSLAQNRLWVLTTSDGCRMSAYAVFDRQDNAEIGLKRLRLVDFQAIGAPHSALAAILGRMILLAQQHGVHVIECVGCWVDGYQLAGLPPPHQRSLPSWMFYYKATDPSLAALSQDSSVWSPSSFDGDASI